MKKVAILTTTFYRSVTETRFHLACQMIGNAVALGYEVIVVDGSADESIRVALMLIGAEVYEQRNKGMGPGRREVFELAENVSDAKIFLWIEPEKVDVIRLIPQIIAPIEAGDADVVIPSRIGRTWQSYPTFQVVSEKAANAVYAEAIGKAFDPMFGPVAFNRDVVGHFATCDPPQQYPGVADGYIQHFAPLTAMAAGYNVKSVDVEFFYPSVQKAEEESSLRDDMVVKRKWQLDQLVEGYRIVAKALHLAPAEQVSS